MSKKTTKTNLELGTEVFDNYLSANQRKALENQIAEVKKPINDKIAKIDAQIEALKQESDNENV